MPPKSKKKSTKKGKSNDNLDGIELQPEDKIKYLESQTQALETQLSQRSTTTADALAEAESLRLKLAKTKEKNKEEKETSMDVMKSMTRQYKSMKEDLLNKINERERTIASLRDEIVLLKSKHAEEIQQNEGLLQQKDKEAETQKKETEELCKHFAHLLSVAKLKIVNYARGDWGVVLSLATKEYCTVEQG